MTNAPKADSRSRASHDNGPGQRHAEGEAPQQHQDHDLCQRQRQAQGDLAGREDAARQRPGAQLAQYPVLTQPDQGHRRPHLSSCWLCGHFFWELCGPLVAGTSVPVHGATADLS
jgi:hypothetical protein